MIYTELTVKAMNLAYKSHHGAVDKGGVPYVFHPIHLAEQMENETAACAALLHDVVEDTDVTIDDLRKDFPDEVVEAVKLLTHDKSEDYFSYLEKIKKNQYALAVKLADITHNSDQSRMCCADGISQQKREELKEKYARAYKFLTE